MSDTEQESSCPCCGRPTPLTFHHLIPKKVHRRKRFKKAFTREQLNQGVRLCRMCHNGIHRLYDEMTLAKEFNTLEALLSCDRLRRHFDWVARQRESHDP